MLLRAALTQATDVSFDRAVGFSDRTHHPLAAHQAAAGRIDGRPSLRCSLEVAEMGRGGSQDSEPSGSALHAVGECQIGRKGRQSAGRDWLRCLGLCADLVNPLIRLQDQRYGSGTATGCVDRSWA